MVAIAAALVLQPALAQQPAFTNQVGMEFVPIPAGEFDMGQVRIGQVHVKISKPFFLGKYEVTQEQWMKVMYLNPSYFNETYFPDDWRQRPVEQVSWLDAKKFAERLSQRDKGFHYRLPTEAEWEYAERAGSSTVGAAAGWYSANSGKSAHPVGKQLPNVWGLYDMNGNVWEWCEDWYDRNRSGKGTVVDPPGPSSGRYRVVRGGSWCDDSGPSSDRSYYEPQHRESCGGVRLAAERTGQ
jgi:formylglycine-generating enzyme required for sulfatase activity